MWPIIRKDWQESAPTFALTLLGNWLIWLLAWMLLPEDGSGLRSRAMVTLLVFVPPIVAASLAADMMAREVESGTLTLLLARPVSRTAVWAAKWLSGLSLAVAYAVGLTGLCSVSEGMMARAGSPHGASSVQLGVNVLALTAACFSISFLASTQIQRRLDALLAGLMAGAVLVLAHRQVLMETVPLSFVIVAGTALATWAVFRFGELLDSRVRNVAAVVALTVVGLATGATLQTLHWLETRWLAPGLVAISDVGPVAGRELILAARTEDRPTNLFRMADTRVARLELVSGQVRWLPHRWVKPRQEASTFQAGPAALPQLDPGPAAGGAPLELEAVRPTLGYPLAYHKPVNLDLATGDLSWTPRSGTDFSFPTAGPAAFTLRCSDEGKAVNPWSLELREAGGGTREVYSTQTNTFLAAWPDGKGLAYLEGQQRRLVLSRLTENGQLASSEMAGAIGLSQGYTGAFGVLLEGVDGPFGSSAGAPGSSLSWAVVAPAERDGDGLCTLRLGRPDGDKLAWKTLIEQVRSHGPIRPLPGGRFLVDVVRPARGDDWDGALAVFDSSGNREAWLDLGPHTRVATARLSPERKKLLLALWGRGEQGGRYLLVDTRTFAVRDLTRTIGTPPAVNLWLRWLNEESCALVTDRQVVLVTLDAAGGGSSRRVFSL